MERIERLIAISLFLRRTTKTKLPEVPVGWIRNAKNSPMQEFKPFIKWRAFIEKKTENTVKPGGLCYADSQNNLINQVNELLKAS